MVMLLLGSLAVKADWVDLWPHEAPGAPQPPAGSEKINEGSRYTDIEVPQYQLFKAAYPNGQGVVILPGGGYRILAMDHEGTEMAKWFNQRGITAMVVKYRVSGRNDFGYQFPVPQLDARRAIRTMRANAEEWNVIPAQIGIVGSSAGGHLASTCATLFEERLEEGEGDEIDAVSCRPDFAVLLYPVIGMDGSWSHGGSARRLLGPEPSPELVQRCSTHLRVTEKTPPIFIVHAADDRSVPLRNATEFMLACAEKKVPVRAAIYPSGGHGFGWKGRGAAEGWIEGLGEWLGTLEAGN